MKIHTAAAAFWSWPLLLFIAVASGCRSTPPVSRSWTAVREVIGDTLIVRTVSGSIWQSPRMLREQLVIGSVDGPEEFVFGRIRGVAGGLEGDVYVFDEQVPALRHYDSLGAYVRTLGGEGGGPGEYGDAGLGLAVRSDGRVIFHDVRHNRLNVYNKDGTPFAHWPTWSAVFTALPMRIDRADHVYLRILAGPYIPRGPWPIGLLHLDARGTVVDTIMPPVMSSEPPQTAGTLLPRKLWDWSPLGAMIVGVSSEYSFDIRIRGQQTLRVQREVRPVPILPEERRDHESRNEWIRHNVGNVPTAMFRIGQFKPAFDALYAADDGRVWIRKHGPGTKDERTSTPPAGSFPRLPWSEPNVFDVFDPEGRYLGEVWAPPNVSLQSIQKDRVWGLRRGAFDEVYIVRYGIEPCASVCANATM